MRNLLSSLGRVAATLAMVALAALVCWQLWVYYMEEPWTRDGRVRADVIGIAPDVSGLVAEVLVRDNQAVPAGAVLFRIDRTRFSLALDQAEAAVEMRRASLDEAISERDRYAQLTTAAVSKEKQQQTEAVAKQSDAAWRQAMTDREVARLNLARTEVRAPVDGVVTNFDLRPGAYVTAGRPVTAFVDSASLHVVGYFEETKLPRIHVGDRVAVHLMGEGTALSGHVESVAAGIEDRERTAGTSLLPNVNPTFSWVRLAQRVPVRVALDPVPPEVRLISGRTATVTVVPTRDAKFATSR